MEANIIFVAISSVLHFTSADSIPLFIYSRHHKQYRSSMYILLLRTAETIEEVHAYCCTLHTYGLSRSCMHTAALYIHTVRSIEELHAYRCTLHTYGLSRSCMHTAALNIHTVYRGAACIPLHSTYSTYGLSRSCMHTAALYIHTVYRGAACIPLHYTYIRFCSTVHTWGRILQF